MHVDDCILHDRLSFRKGGELLRRMNFQGDVRVGRITDQSATFLVDNPLALVVIESGDGVEYCFTNVKTGVNSKWCQNPSLVALNYKRGTYNALK